MHVGMAAVFQNPQKSRTDRDVYRQELRLADLAEPLGFESIWGVEHHFTDYTMCPDVLQFLTYMAGRTQRGRLARIPGAGHTANAEQPEVVNAALREFLDEAYADA